MRVFILSVALLAACGDNKRPTNVTPDAAPDAPVAVGPCLDRPDDLPMPPTGALPCELLPPGFVAP